MSKYIVIYIIYVQNVHGTSVKTPKIQTLQSMSCIYLQGLLMQCNRLLLRNNLLFMCVLMHCVPGEDWKKVWKNKRDSFAKKRKEMLKCPSGSAAKKINKGPLYEQMSFLIDHLAGRRYTRIYFSVLIT